MSQEFFRKRQSSKEPEYNTFSPDQRLAIRHTRHYTSLLALKRRSRISPASPTKALFDTAFTLNFLSGQSLQTIPVFKNHCSILLADASVLKFFDQLLTSVSHALELRYKLLSIRYYCGTDIGTAADIFKVANNETIDTRSFQFLQFR